MNMIPSKCYSEVPLETEFFLISRSQSKHPGKSFHLQGGYPLGKKHQVEPVILRCLSRWGGGEVSNYRTRLVLAICLCLASRFHRVSFVVDLEANKSAKLRDQLAQQVQFDKRRLNTH